MDRPASRWAPVIGFVLASSANQMAWLAFAPITTGAAARYGVSNTTIGLLSEIFPLLYVLLAVPAGRAVDRSLRTWLAAGAVLGALGTVVRLGGANLFGAAGATGASGGGFAWVFAGQFMAAAAQPLLLNSVTALARGYLRPADRPFGISIASAGTFLGFVLAFVTARTFGAGHLDLLLALGAGYATLGAAVLVVALGRTPCLPTPEEVPALVGGVAGGPVPVARDGVGEMRRLWADSVMRSLVWFVFVGFGVFVSLTTWVQPLLQPAGVSTADADTLLTFMVLAGMVSSAAFPPLVARRGLQLPALAAGGVATISGCSLLAAAPGVVSAAVALCLVGFFLLPGLPIVLEVAERRSGAGAGAGAGLLWMAGQAGGIVVAVVSGAAQGTPWLAFSALAAVVLAAVPLAGRLRGQLPSSLAG
ncbi:MAG: MFS transporter [Acidimicrobiales bacterium]